MTRTIAFLTGARSEYDLLAPVIRALLNDGRCQPTVIPAAGHLSPFHGHSLHQIEADGFRIAFTVESLLSSETWRGRSLSFAQLISGLTQGLAAQRPDILVVAGDREEALAGAIVGNFLGIPVAHLFGGDRCRASDVDEAFRPAISKLAHLHFTATAGHRDRLIRMGENPEHVWAVGATGLDSLRAEAPVPDAVLNDRFGIDPAKPFFLMIHHPSPWAAAEDVEAETAAILRGVLASGIPVLCGYPNFDPGNVAVRSAIDTAKRDCPRLITYHNLPRSLFVALYRRCAAVVGNSSSIVIESGFLRVAGVLIGPRQDFRETGPNVLRISATERAVADACQRVLSDVAFRQTVHQCPSLYGDGHASERIANILATIDLPTDLMHKTMPY